MNRSGPIPVECKRLGSKKQNIGPICRPRRPNWGPITVVWKKLGRKSKNFGLRAAPTGLIAAP